LEIVTLGGAEADDGNGTTETEKKIKRVSGLADVSLCNIIIAFKFVKKNTFYSSSIKYFH
jgi:hypothetical protein